MSTAAFEAIGTHWHIEFDESDVPADPDAVFSRIRARIEQYDKDYSRFRKDSLVTEMATKAGAYTLPPDAQPLFDLYQELYEKTGGRFTPLIGQTMSQAGYDAEYSLTPGNVTPTPTWEDTLVYEYPSLTLTRPALLDIGAAGKGYLVDLVAGLLETEGASSYVVDAGGDLRIRAKAPLRIGLEHPENPDEAIGVVTLNSGSICGSAGNRRAWGKYTHIIDPASLASPTDVLATWVVAETALLADAVSTCLFFVPAAALSPLSFEHLVLRADYSIDRSGAFPAELFIS